MSTFLVRAVPMIVLLLFVPCTTPRVQAQCIPGPMWTGDGTYDLLGAAVAGGSDISGDGIPDFLISAPGWDTAHSNYSNNGRVYVYSGADYSLLHIIESPVTYFATYVGRALDTLGDLNGDGYGDFLVGVGGWIDGTDSLLNGAVLAFSGHDYSILYALHDTLGNSMGQMAECIGDITKDGINDFITGGTAAYGFPSRTNVYDGATGEVLTTYTDPDGNLFQTGNAGAGVGDLDGDTYPDFVIAAPYWSIYSPSAHEGRIDVYSGRTFELLWSLEGDTTETYLGIAVSGVGDVNGDGVRDVLCGTRFGVTSGANNTNGYALILSGTDGAVIRKHMAPIFNNREFGVPVAGLGDLNHDGYADYGIGDFSFNVGNGGSWAFSGLDGSLLQSLGGGVSLAIAGDTDADGTNDILAGHTRAKANGLLSGAVTLRLCMWPDSACRTGVDTDGDGWNDGCDDCPFRPDIYQFDGDDDGVGDACTRTDTVVSGAAIGIYNTFGGITFQSVTTDGSVTFEEGAYGPASAGLFAAIPQSAPRYYSIETTAGYAGDIEVCLRYDPAGLTAQQEAGLRLYHHNGSDWQDITSAVNMGDQTVCGITTALSPFAVGLPVVVGVDDPDRPQLPERVQLAQSYPNPCNPSATIEFTLPEAMNVRLTVFDVLGRFVITLVDAPMPAGPNRVRWYGRNAEGEFVASGTYFYRLETPDGAEGRKMLLLR